MDVTSKALADFLTIKQKIRSAKSTEVSKKFLSIRRPLTNFETRLDEFVDKFQGKLQKILPDIKSGLSAESELVALLDTYIESPFHIEEAIGFLERRNREINTIKLAMTKNDAFEVTDLEGGTDNRCLFEAKYAVSYVMNVLPKNDTAEAYFSGEKPPRHQWFDDEEKVTSAGQKFKLFKEFANANFEDPDHCFMVQLKQVAPSPVSIRVAGSAKDFDIPPAPKKPTLRAKSFQNVTLEIGQIDNSYGNGHGGGLTGLVVKFTDIIDNSEGQFEAAYEAYDIAYNIVTVTGLKPNTSYSMTVQYKTEPGLSPPSPVLLVQTLLTSPKPPGMC
jgi:hypothetical protein